MTGQRGHKPLTCRTLRQIPLQKAVAVRHVNVLTARSLCFPHFPAASLQLGIPVRIRNDFPGLYCGKAHSLRPNRTRFSINLDQDGRHFKWWTSGRTYANPELRMGIQWQILARQKADMGIYSHPIVWRRSTTKGSQRLRQKNVSGKMKRSGAGEKRWTQRNIYRETKECGHGYNGNRCAKQKRTWEKAWNYCVEQKRPRRKAKQSRWRRPGTSARNKR